MKKIETMIWIIVYIVITTINFLKGVALVLVLPSPTLIIL